MKSADPSQSTGSRGTGTGEGSGDRIRQAGREAMSDATEGVREEARTRLEQGKSAAAESAASTSDVLEHAAEDFSAHGQETLARTTGMLAGQLSQLAEQLERRSLDDLSQEAMRLARRNPGLFLAGGVALGIALSRFFKASTPGTHEHGGGHRGETGGDTSQWSGGAAYGGEGALPSQGTGSRYPGSPLSSGPAFAESSGGSTRASQEPQGGRHE